MKYCKEEISDLIYRRPHLVQDFYRCEFRFYLHLNRFYIQDNPLLAIGRVLHKKKLSKESLVKIDSYDFWRGEVIELKKKDFDVSDELQLYLYLKLLSDLGFFVSKGKLASVEKRKKVTVTYPDQKYESLLDAIVDEVSNWEGPPKKIRNKLCKNCSMYDYCWGGE